MANEKLWNYLEKIWKPTKTIKLPLKKHVKKPKTMKLPWKIMKTNQKTWNYPEKKLVNCPTRQSLLLFIGSLHWLSSWRWWPSMWGGKIVSATLEARNGRFDPFFCKSHKLHISRWRILFLPSCIWCISPSNTCILRTYHEFPKMGVTYSNPHFRKFVNFRKLGLLIVTLIFGNSWISENGGYL